MRLIGGVAAGTPKAFFAAIAEAFRAPVGPGTPEVAKASERLVALRRNPLPAPESAPEADCVGRLGIVPRQRTLDPATPEGLTELEAARAKVLTAARTALAAVGPAALCTEAEGALNETEGWLAGAAPEDAWPAADTASTHAANDVARNRARVTVAARVAEPLAAVSAAERLGDPHGPLRSRLSALPSAFRVTEVIGVARPRGGCVSITAETDGGGRDALASAGALAAAIARKEIAAEVRAPADPLIASRAVVAATDPRDAAARAAWWALSGSAPGSPDRWATLLAVAPDDRGEIASVAKRFDESLGGALRASDAAVVERRAAVEQGQGELWVLLASTCGTADEGPLDAGASALAALAATSREPGDVSIEPWITAEGVGVLAHAQARAEDDANLLARRVASAAARAFVGEVPTKDTVGEARVAALAQIERTAGPHGAVLDGLLGALAPEHPTQLYAMGPFARLLALGVPHVVSRWQALANGPLRMAVIANGAAPQSDAAFGAADHWLAPRAAPRACTATSDAALRPGRYEVALPPGAELSQALIAGPVAARGQPGRDLAELAAHLLAGERGLVQAALDRTPVPATASARLLGGARSSALVIDVRAPEAALGDAVDEVKALLARLGQDGPSDPAIEIARSKKQRAVDDAAFDPRSRLVKLWLGEPVVAPSTPTRAALQAFFAAAFKETAIVLVEAKK